MTSFVRDFFTKKGAIRTALGACDINGAMTVVALVKFREENNEWLWSRVNAANGEAGGWTNLGKEAGHIHFQPGGNPGVNFPAGTNWALIVAVCPAGTKKRRYYIKRFPGGVFPEAKWFEEEDTATHAVTHEGVPARIQFGRWNETEQFTGRMAAMAVYPIAFGKELAEELAALPSIKHWLSWEPEPEFTVEASGLWMFNQASTAELVKDLTGNGADEIEGASVATEPIEEEPPIPYEPESGGTQIIEAGTAEGEASMPEPTISIVTITEHVIDPEAALVTCSASGEVVAGGMPSPTNDGRTGGLPLPFPNIVANPGRLGPPRFSNADRKALGL